MGKAVGIDLGSTKSVVAVWDEGKVRILPNAEGGRATPSVVALTEEGAVLVGKAALEQAVLNPATAVHSVKRCLGRLWEEVDAASPAVGCGLVPGPADALRFSLDGQMKSPEEVVSLILGKLIEDASMQLGGAVEEAVITVPASFNEVQRQAMSDAAEMAGIKVLRLLHETTAAALAYGFESGRNETLVVLDAGGGKSDASTVEVGRDVCEVLAVAGDTLLGGMEFDRRLADWIASGFKSERGIDLRDSPQSRRRLLDAAERARCELSGLQETHLDLPFIVPAPQGLGHLRRRVTRDLLERLTGDLVQRCAMFVQQAMEDSRIAREDLDRFLLVGGLGRMPALQDMVKGVTGGLPPAVLVDPCEAAAGGAALQAAMLQGRLPEVIVLDVLSHSLGIETREGSMTRLIPRNTTIPARRQQVFSLPAESWQTVDVAVLQGESPRAGDNRLVGRVRVDNIHSRPGETLQIQVTFDVDANGMLNVTARDMMTGREQEVVLRKSAKLSRSEGAGLERPSGSVDTV